MEQERLGKVAPGRVACDDNLALADSNVVDEVMVAGEGLDELRRVAVLGREACARLERQRTSLGANRTKGRTVVERKDGRVQSVLVLDLLDDREEELVRVGARVEAAKATSEVSRGGQNKEAQAREEPHRKAPPWMK